MHLLRTESKEQLALHLTKSLRKQQKTELANIKSPQHEGNMKMHIMNYFQYKESYVCSEFEKQNFLLPHKGEVFRRLPLPKINRHFHYNTVE